MNQRPDLFFKLLLFALIFNCCSTPDFIAQDKPNIIILFADDLGDEDSLNPIIEKLFGVSIGEIKMAFK